MRKEKEINTHVFLNLSFITHFELNDLSYVYRNVDASYNCIDSKAQVCVSKELKLPVNA